MSAPPVGNFSLTFIFNFLSLSTSLIVSLFISLPPFLFTFCSLSSQLPLCSSWILHSCFGCLCSCHCLMLTFTNALIFHTHKPRHVHHYPHSLWCEKTSSSHINWFTQNNQARAAPAFLNGFGEEGFTCIKECRLMMDFTQARQGGENVMSITPSR